MRLIDAEKIDFGEVIIDASDFAKDTRAAAQNLIDAQPTAYDINRVLECLEREKYKSPNCRYDHGVNDMCDVAINIVKTGGSNE